MLFVHRPHTNPFTKDPVVSLATLPVDQILKLSFPSFHKPLELARALNRSGSEEDRRKALALLEGLITKYHHVLAIGQEYVLALAEYHEHDRAEQVLKLLEKSFSNLDEELLCRWGRLFKNRGDAYVGPTVSRPDSPPPDPVLAAEFYRRSLEKYDQAYRIRSGHYPGINKATLLLIVGWLKSAASGAPRAVEIHESAELAGRLLADRPHWPRDQPDDETDWHPATAGEAHLLRQEWSQAAAQYREALKGKSVTAHARESMRRQVERILMCFLNLGVAIRPPFDDAAALFSAQSHPSSGAASESPGGPSEQ